MKGKYVHTFNFSNYNYCICCGHNTRAEWVVVEINRNLLVSLQTASTRIQCSDQTLPACSREVVYPLHSTT